MDVGKEATKALALYFAEKPRACAAAFIELGQAIALEAEQASGLLAKDAEPYRQPDHGNVIGQQPAPGPKNLQACAAGSHDWGPYDPSVGGHECLACGTIYTRRA